MIRAELSKDYLQALVELPASAKLHLERSEFERGKRKRRVRNVRVLEGKSIGKVDEFG